jgi:hypothetical protein
MNEFDALEGPEITDDTLRRITGLEISTAELRHMRDQLARDGQDESSDEFKSALANRWAPLLADAQVLQTFDPGKFKFDEAVVSVSELLRPWREQRLPYMHEGINDVPQERGTQGQIGTAGLYVGGLGFGGTMHDAGTVAQFRVLPRSCDSEPSVLPFRRGCRMPCLPCANAVWQSPPVRHHRFD